MYALRILSHGMNRITRYKFSTFAKPEYIDYILEAQKLNLPKKNVAIFVQVHNIILLRLFKYKIYILKNITPK